MSGRSGLILGALIGISLGLVGVLTTMHLMSGQVQEKQSEAFDRGVESGLELATQQGTTLDISGKVNTGLMDENKMLGDQLDATRNKLQALQARDDLTPQAQDQVALILEGLK